MMRRTLIISGIMAGFLLAGWSLHLLSRGPTVTVVGELPRPDLNNVLKVSRRFMFAGRYGPSPTSALREFSGRIRYYIDHPIDKVEVNTTNFVTVWFRRPRWRDDTGLRLEKRAAGWEVTMTYFQ